MEDIKRLPDAQEVVMAVIWNAKKRRNNGRSQGKSERKV